MVNEATQLLVSLWDENAGAMSREYAGERDREAVARPSKRKRARAEAESRPGHLNEQQDSCWRHLKTYPHFKKFNLLYNKNMDQSPQIVTKVKTKTKVGVAFVALGVAAALAVFSLRFKKPDLVVGVNVARCNVDGARTYQFRIKNIGTAPTGPFETRVWGVKADGATTISYASFPSAGLAAGESGIVENSFSAEFVSAESVTGFFVNVDALNAVAELSEINNTASAGFICLSDLTAEISSTSCEPDGSAKYTYKIKNQGTADAGAFSTLVAGAFGDGTVAYTTTYSSPGLAAGFALTQSGVLPAASSPYAALKVSADATEAVAESNEANNSFTAALDCPPPS